MSVAVILMRVNWPKEFAHFHKRTKQTDGFIEVVVSVMLAGPSVIMVLKPVKVSQGPENAFILKDDQYFDNVCLSREDFFL